MSKLSALFALVWPDRCPGCEARARSDSALGLCDDCEGDLEKEMSVIQLPGSIVRGWALGAYEGPLGGVVRRAKYGPDPGLSAALGRALGRGMMGRVGVDAVAAVPMARRRRMGRGFDQAEWMGVWVARALGVPLLPLLRRRPGAAQVGRDRSERRALGPRDFSVLHRSPDRVLLVDDVVTTGASVHACARLLRRHGATQVWVGASAAQFGCKDFRRFK